MTVLSLARGEQEIARQLRLAEMFGGVPGNDDQDLALCDWSASRMLTLLIERTERQIGERTSEARPQIVPPRDDKGGIGAVRRELTRAIAPAWYPTERFEDILFRIPQCVNRQDVETVRLQGRRRPVQTLGIQFIEAPDQPIERTGDVTPEDYWFRYWCHQTIRSHLNQDGLRKISAGHPD